MTASRGTRCRKPVSRFGAVFGILYLLIMVAMLAALVNVFVTDRAVQPVGP